MQKMQVQFLSQEDPLEKEMTTHSNILAWEIPWTEDPGEPMRSQKSQTQLSNQPNHNNCHVKRLPTLSLSRSTDHV